MKQSNDILSRIIVCDYEPAYYDAIIDLWGMTGLGGVQRGDNRTVIEHSLKLGGKLLIAKDSDGTLVGTSWITFDGRRMHLHHVGVLPEYQRNGIGHLLSVKSIDYARDNRIQIKLEVHRNNQAAISLYKKLGFQYLGDYDVYIIRNYDHKLS